MQPIRTICLILVGDNIGTIPDEFGRSHKRLTFPYIIQCKIVTPGRVKFDPRVIIWTILVDDF